jgi:tRNA nucleotidyltransferase (CCA-adding enzyme)
VTRVAAEKGAPPYLIGGPVRDLILRRPVGDVDLLLPGALEAVARAAAKRLGARTVIHARFLTARLETADLRIDLSQARSERYPSPGALPVVRPATVERDLERRDFTIHAMALPLDGAAGAHLLDPFEGRLDLGRGLLRTLHDDSFRDDPTRMFRAARYAARFGFRLAAETREQLGRATSGRALDSVSGDRVVHELERLLAEKDPSRAARETRRWGLFEAIVRRWSLAASVGPALRRFAETGARAPWPEVAGMEVRRACGLAILMLELPARYRNRVLARLGIEGRAASAIETDLERVPGLRRALAQVRRPGSLDALLDGSSDARLLLLFCTSRGATADAARRYARELRHVPSALDGHTARRLGAVGSEIGELLHVARRRALDGHPVDAQWAGRWLARRHA